MQTLGLDATPDFVRALLDTAMARLRCATDSQLARRLGVSPSCVCSYRKGRALPGHSMARTLARIARLSPVEVIAQIRRERLQRKRHYCGTTGCHPPGHCRT